MNPVSSAKEPYISHYYPCAKCSKWAWCEQAPFPLCSALFPKRALYLPQKSPFSPAQDCAVSHLNIHVRTCSKWARCGEASSPSSFCKRNRVLLREVQGSFGEKSAAQRRHDAARLPLLRPERSSTEEPYFSSKRALYFPQKSPVFPQKCPLFPILTSMCEMQQVSAMRQAFVSFVPADLLPFIEWTEVQRQVIIAKSQGSSHFLQ